MRRETARIIRLQLQEKCACGQPATRVRVRHYPKPDAPITLGHGRVNFCVDGSYTLTESACDLHSTSPPEDGWRDHLFAEAVRELNTEAE